MAKKNNLPDLPKVKVRVTEDGLLQGMNPDGSIAWTQKAGSYLQSTKLKHSHRSEDCVYTVLGADGVVIRMPYDVSIIQAYRKCWPYVEEIAMEIIRRMAEGDTITKICSEDGFPPLYVISKWRTEIPGFATMMGEARKLRAEIQADEIVTIKDNVTERTSKSAKVKLEALRYLTAVGDPETYGAKTKITGDPNAPVSFLFNTGIVREERAALPGKDPKDGGTETEGD